MKKNSKSNGGGGGLKSVPLDGTPSLPIEKAVSEEDANDLALLDQELAQAKIALADNVLTVSRLEGERHQHVAFCNQKQEHLNNKFKEVARTNGINPENPEGSWTYKIELKKFVRNY